MTNVQESYLVNVGYQSTCSAQRTRNARQYCTRICSVCDFVKQSQNSSLGISDILIVVENSATYFANEISLCYHQEEGSLFILIFCTNTN